MRVLSWGILLLGLGAARASAQTAPRPCTVDAVDTTFTRTGPAYRDCDVDQPARLRRDSRPTYVFPLDSRCVTAELVFVVDTTGIPDSATAVIVETDAPDYAQLLAGSLPAWRYRAAQLNGVAVRQVVRERRILAVGRADGRVPFVITGLSESGASARPAQMPPSPRFVPSCQS